MKRINVIIPTFRRPEYLNRTLASLVNQKTTVTYEVLVIDDDGIDPRPKNVAEFWAKRGPVSYLTPGNNPKYHGRTRIRNFGIAYATADIVVFLDDDMLVTPDFIEEHWKSHQNGDKNTVVVGYRNHLKVTPSFLEHISPSNLASEAVRFSELPSVKDEREDIYQLCQGNLNALAAAWTIVYSNNFSLRRTFLQQIGGRFNESFQGAWGGEDIELGYRLQKAGADFVLNRKAVGYHQWHYANWRRNMLSLHENLRRFYSLYPTTETELYINYPETGLQTYFKDLRRYTTAPLADSDSLCERRIVRSELEKHCDARSKILLIGAGNAPSLWRQPSIKLLADPRNEVIELFKSKRISSYAELAGCHLLRPNKTFDCVIVTDYVCLLTSYHRTMVIQEACRLAKHEVIIVVPTKILASDASLAMSPNNQSSAFAKWAGIDITTAEITVSTIGTATIASVKPIVKTILLVDQPAHSRLALIIPSDSEDTHTEHALELGIALAKHGCEIAIQQEDHRRQSLIYAESVPGMRRFSTDEQKLLRSALQRDLRGRNHLFPRLSLTGNYHFHGKRVDWIMENKIGLLASPYVQVLNDESDTLWIPSGKVAQLFQQSGVHASKIREMPIGIPDGLVNGFMPSRRDKQMRFVAIGTVGKADGLDIALEAYCMVAKDLPHSSLKVRILPIESREVVANDLRQNLTVRLSHRKHIEDVMAIHQFRIRKWKRFVRERGLANKVSFENIDYKIRAWPEYLHDADCLIQCQRVDVTGHWILRAMALRIPVISTGRYLPESLKARWMNYFIQNRELSAADREWASNVVYTRWVEPQAESLVRHLRHIYRNRRDSWRRADLAQQYVKERLTWSRLISLYAKDLSNIAQTQKADLKTLKLDEANLFDQLKQHNLINLEEEPFERR